MYTGMKFRFPESAGDLLTLRNCKHVNLDLDPLRFFVREDRRRKLWTFVKYRVFQKELYNFESV